MREPALLDARQALGRDAPASRRDGATGAYTTSRGAGAPTQAGGGARERRGLGRRGRGRRGGSPSRSIGCAGSHQLGTSRICGVEPHGDQVAPSNPAGGARAPSIAGDDEPLRRARHRDIEQAAMLARRRLARRGARLPPSRRSPRRAAPAQT